MRPATKPANIGSTIASRANERSAPASRSPARNARNIVEGEPGSAAAQRPPTPTNQTPQMSITGRQASL